MSVCFRRMLSLNKALSVCFAGAPFAWWEDLVTAALQPWPASAATPPAAVSDSHRFSSRSTFKNILTCPPSPLLPSSPSPPCPPRRSAFLVSSREKLEKQIVLEADSGRLTVMSPQSETLFSGCVHIHCSAAWRPEAVQPEAVRRRQDWKHVCGPTCSDQQSYCPH